MQSTASALGSIVPYAITGAVGAAYKLLPITIRAINTVVGTIQGVGAVKGSIYEAVKEELSKTLPEDQAKEQARLAQETLGKNLPSMIGGGALGGLGARTGVENLLQEVLVRSSVRSSCLALAKPPWRKPHLRVPKVVKSSSHRTWPCRKSAQMFRRSVVWLAVPQVMQRLERLPQVPWAQSVARPL